MTFVTVTGRASVDFGVICRPLASHSAIFRS
jgi:hypothetical protein